MHCVIVTMSSQLKLTTARLKKCTAQCLRSASSERIFYQPELVRHYTFVILILSTWNFHHEFLFTVRLSRIVSQNYSITLNYRSTLLIDAASCANTPPAIT